MVNNGAIDEELFNETNGEHIFVYMKIQPVIEDLRAMFDNQEFLKNLETVVKRIPDIETKLPAMRERMAKFADDARRSRVKAQAAAA